MIQYRLATIPADWHALAAVVLVLMLEAAR
jgi:hypothetical protein